jgi:peroxiredoxin
MNNQKANPSYQHEVKGLIKQLDQMLPAEQFAVFNKEAEELAKQFEQPLKLQKGDHAPDFRLSNATGQAVQLSNLLRQGAVVLFFYRGAWCPYCNLQLQQLQQVLPQIKAAGAQLVAISPQKPDHSLDMKQKNDLAFEVLTDEGNQVAQMFTTVFQYGDASLQAMKDLGYDFFDFYNDQSKELPVPATFIIEPNGVISFAASEGGDYRDRVEPSMILEALKH